MNYHIIAYSIYLPVTIALSIWIAKSLHKNTKAFLMEKFGSREELANATNNLIQTGFYLIALGFSFKHLTITPKEHYEKGVMTLAQMNSGQETIETLASKLGSFTLVLGILLFLNFLIMIAIQSPKKQESSTTI
jgi:hypothetical protein